jgi:hypothetical protein
MSRARRRKMLPFRLVSKLGWHNIILENTITMRNDVLPVSYRKLRGGGKDSKRSVITSFLLVMWTSSQQLYCLIYNELCVKCSQTCRYRYPRYNMRINVNTISLCYIWLRFYPMSFKHLFHAWNLDPSQPASPSL